MQLVGYITGAHSGVNKEDLREIDVVTVVDKKVVHMTVLSDIYIPMSDRPATDVFGVVEGVRGKKVALDIVELDDKLVILSYNIIK